MLCKNYIARLLKSHGLDTKLKLDLSESNTDLSKSKKDANNTGTSIVHTVDKLSHAQPESCASSETSEKYRNYCGPLISDKSKQMHD